MGGSFDTTDNLKDSARSENSADFSDELYSQKQGSGRLDAMNQGATLERVSGKSPASDWLGQSNSVRYEIPDEMKATLKSAIANQWKNSEKQAKDGR
jgi:hypothetical protein